MKKVIELSVMKVFLCFSQKFLQQKEDDNVINESN